MLRPGPDVARRLVLVAAVALLIVAVGAAPAAAHPPKPVSKKGKKLKGPWHRYLHQAKVPVVKGRLKIFLNGCPRRPRLAGCVYTRRKYRLYLRRRLHDRRGVFYHELGHLFDLRVMRRRHRRAFKRIFGLKRGAWFGGRRPPGEQFAEAYSYCARHRRIRRTRISSRARYGYRATPAQHRAVCALIGTAAAKPPRRPDPPKAPPVIVEPAPVAAPPQPPAPAPPPPRNGLGRLVDPIF